MQALVTAPGPSVVDTWVAGCLLPLAAWILLSGLDDLVVLIAFLFHRLWPRKTPAPPPPERLRKLPEKRIAVFVPLWREDRVIADMVDHNLTAINYRNYDFFIGGYPNDEATLRVVRELQLRYPNVHLSLCPHDGPTSKADCLNWIYQRMLLFEEENGARFEIVVTHDAEDLIHPEALSWINYYAEDYGMIQIPVLPLRTAARMFTHGLYCDDFAEAHTKDMRARQTLGGFIPSSGVGTGYCRWALEKLATSEANRVFEPASLTEDYENGFRLHLAGCPQIFVPIHLVDGAPVATREYFPHDFGAAVKQRTRWVTGIALQTWERHGWSGGRRQLYWLWRDRKGLFASPISLFSNLLFIYGAATWLVSWWSGSVWGLMQAMEQPILQYLLTATLTLQLVNLGVRAACVARIYGFRFALGVPFRTVYGNCLNSVSAVVALVRYFGARIHHEPLLWLKTEHLYPSRVALMPHKRRLGEILIGFNYITEEDLEAARESKPRGVRIGEHLVRLGKLTEDELYEALSLQLNLPAGPVDPDDVPQEIARTLPANVAREWQVLPFRIASGNLFVASPEVPTDEMQQEIRKFTRMEIRIQLVTPANFRQLSEQLL